EVAVSGAPAASPAATFVEEPPPVIRFAIDRFVVEGAKLLTQAEFDKAVAPYVGKQKDFSDVQHALEAVEELYAQRGYSAVHVLLPEQELEAGTVRFQVIEGRFGTVTVKDNRFASEENVLNAIPSVRKGGVPSAKRIARELRLANENPARQLNVVLKAGEQDDQVDASVLVTDSDPVQWSATLDNSGSKETGRSRLGFSFRDANAFDSDHVAQVQIQMSPQYLDRVKVFGGSYKIPLYQYGHSVEFFGGYSNVNSLVGGLSNFQGGGLMFSSRYNVPLERWGTFDPRVTFGLDWRKFSKIELTNPPPTILYDDIVVTPLSVAYSAQGRMGKGDVNFNGSFVLNVPTMSQGKSADFAAYDHINFSSPKPAYKVLRYGAAYFAAFAKDWQFRTALSGQWSGDTLIQGEQMRLGGADAVRGFSEGSETGEVGAKLNLEVYSPAYEKGDAKLRGLVFVDGGMVKVKGGNSTTISGAGFGLRSAYSEHYSLRLDVGRIMKAGNDPEQLKGDWRIHASLSATF
ncbi:MAG: ShlB/FhaC/HecB family hemolysin secretion/activation protein, partial [Sideroxyarcus sp.]|nr:ShlB/FhaC/HecB family hemolysin secretion/activation protein [Sideroxyarcus sp.]